MKDFVVKCSKVFPTDFNTTSTSIIERHGSGHPLPTHISILTNLGDYYLEYAYYKTYYNTPLGVDDLNHQK
jgi:hypothetical protein